MKLKPCPFCGGEAKLERGTTQLDNFVYCSDCGSGTRFFNTKQSAIETWNRREPIDQIVELLEENWETVRGGYAIYRSRYYEGKMDAYDEAIRIVKGSAE